MHPTHATMEHTRVANGTKNSFSICSLSCAGVHIIYSGHTGRHGARPRYMGVGGRNALLPLLLSLGSAGGTLYQLTRMRTVLVVSPDPQSTSTSYPWDWSSAGPAFTLANTEATRINVRGLHTFAPRRRLRDLGKMGWTGVPCNLSSWALCSSHAGAVLPSFSPRVAEAPHSVVTDWSRLTCGDNTGKTLVSQPYYDISACDIIDEGLDVVFSKNEVFHVVTAMPLWRYWVCIVLAVALVRTLSHNVHRSWIDQNSSEPNIPQCPALVGIGAIMVLVLIDRDYVYVTHADQLFFWISIAYVCVYLVNQCLDRMHLPQPGEAHAPLEMPVFNIIIGTLQVLAMRLYCAAETPYNVVLISMLACRSWAKVVTYKYHEDARRSLTLTCDAIYLSLASELAYTGNHELLIAVFGVAYVAACLVTHRASMQDNVCISNREAHERQL